MSTDNPVGYVAQSTNNTCWAASTAMLLGWSDDMQVVQDMKEKFPDSVVKMNWWNSFAGEKS